MARYYKPVTELEFKTKIVEFLDKYEHDLYELPQTIQKDLSKVEFDYENYEFGYSDYHKRFDINKDRGIGYFDLGNDLHVLFCFAGGDWEYPVTFILYLSTDGFRAYVPKDGNTWNYKLKSAFGNNDDEIEYDEIQKIFNFESMVSEIKNRIIIK